MTKRVPDETTSVAIHRDTPAWRLIETAERLGIDFSRPITIAALNERDLTIKQREPLPSRQELDRDDIYFGIRVRLDRLEKTVDRIQTILPSTRDPSEPQPPPPLG